MEQGLWQGCALSQLLFNIFFVAVLKVVPQEFSEDPAILVELVHLKEPSTSMGPVQSFTYLGDALTETPDMSVEIAKRTRAWWKRIRWYLRKLYDQLKVALFLKTRMVKAEAIEALLYGCST